MAVRIGETWRNDGPEDTCFGCGHQNEQGLKVVFRRVAADAVEARYEAAPHWCGAPDIVHGGIQAALLDEVLGAAAHCGFDEEPDGSVNLVTVDFQLHYRRPCRAGVPLLLRGELLRVEGRDVFVEGAIRDAEGETLTTAEARWRRLRS
ncbi:MAG: PaaI family thioesterase [Deltaproteobacteria bacterium]|nr:PaaI family thioesterase [Deltaproteobacteria bacterium]MBW2445595.1 PaaI family thioesterase [Deltaproteobacteria bacterium]